MRRNINLILSHIEEVKKQGFQVEYPNDFHWVCINGLELPGRDRGNWTSENGEKISYISVLINIPVDWPVSRPGVGFSHPINAIHGPLLHYNGRRIRELYDCKHKPWYWLCFQRMDWSPDYGLVELLQIIELSLWDRAK